MTEPYTLLDLLAAVVVTAEDLHLPMPVRYDADEVSAHLTLTFTTKGDAAKWLPYMELANDGGHLWHGWTVELNGPAIMPNWTPGRAVKTALPLPPQDYADAVEEALIRADLCIRPTISGKPCTKGYDHLGHCEPDAVEAIVAYVRERQGGAA